MSNYLRRWNADTNNESNMSAMNHTINHTIEADILIIGAGPSGLAAAAAALEANEFSSALSIHIIDDNFFSGGQIWRGGANTQKDQRAHDLWNKLSNSTNVKFHFQSKVVLAQTFNNGLQKLIVESGETSRIFIAKKLIIATGARELLLPFPGWTLPGVTGAGGMQALSKNGFPVAGKRIVVAGSGPLLLAVADSLIQRGAIVTHIIEQTSFTKLIPFAFQLFKTPNKLFQAMTLWKNLRKIPYYSDSYVKSAQGNHHLENITIKRKGQQETIECDYLACGYGLLPNVEIAALLNCFLEDNGLHPTVKVNDFQQSSEENIYCAGEGTGIGGVDLALVEGTIAGYAATNNLKKAQQYFQERENGKRFGKLLQSTFSLRPELKQLCQEDTIVCRCEDVKYAALQHHQDWRSAKLHTRCGMGACQGKICGAANRFIFSWEKDQGRLPISNATIQSLCLVNHKEKE